MRPHSFLLIPGIWLGQGVIKIAGVEERLRYYTRWKVSAAVEGVIFCTQEVEVQGVSEKKSNLYLFSDVKNSSFYLELDSESLGKIGGKGVIKEKVIAWELHGSHEQCEGFEIFELVSEDRYSTHAEFGSDKQENTVIQGLLWRSE